MYSVWDPFIGYMFIGYIMLSIAAAPCLIGYILCKVLSKLKTRFKVKE